MSHFETKPLDFSTLNFGGNAFSLQALERFVCFRNQRPRNMQLATWSLCVILVGMSITGLHGIQQRWGWGLWNPREADGVPKLTLKCSAQLGSVLATETQPVPQLALSTKRGSPEAIRANVLARPFQEHDQRYNSGPSGSGRGMWEFRNGVRHSECGANLKVKGYLQNGHSPHTHTPLELTDPLPQCSSILNFTAVFLFFFLGGGSPLLGPWDYSRRQGLLLRLELAGGYHGDLASPWRGDRGDGGQIRRQRGQRLQLGHLHCLDLHRFPLSVRLEALRGLCGRQHLCDLLHLPLRQTAPGCPEFNAARLRGGQYRSHSHRAWKGGRAPSQSP